MPLSRALRTAAAVAAVVLVLGTVTGAYAWYFADRILPGTSVGAVPVGGLTRDAAAGRLQEALDEVAAAGIRLTINGGTETIATEAIGLDLNIGAAVDDAFARGHTGSGAAQVWQRVAALWAGESIAAPVALDERALATALSDIAAATGTPRKDIRLSVSGTTVTLLTDTMPGRAIDAAAVASGVRSALARLEPVALTADLQEDLPKVAPDSGPEAADAARRMIARPLVLQYEDFQYYIGRERLGAWLSSEYRAGDDGGPVRLVPVLDANMVAQYVAGVAAQLNVAPEPPQVSTQDGRVTGFVPAKVGRAVQEDVLAGLIAESVAARVTGTGGADTIVIPMKTTKMALTGLDDAAGITELVGKATTPFTGSPKNRIYNIKNGVKFLSGTVIQPGEEFSTLKTLGTIDNTTGYLPELVIKGDRTTPEFGGGLCQVSTTLFRAALDAGLPITARRNHSFRISYYEKDGNGTYIGPGLDATIYEPDLDLKFVNDTAHPLLIIGYVVGDKITFEFYGTRDGRTSHVSGPTVLTETPAGEAVYIETTELAPGVIRQVEFPHPGGSTTATYTVTYPDGTMKTQEFKSWYRRWPAKYLKGVAQLSSPLPVSPPTPSPSPAP